MSKDCYGQQKATTPPFMSPCLVNALVLAAATIYEEIVIVMMALKASVAIEVTSWND